MKKIAVLLMVLLVGIGVFHTDVSASIASKWTDGMLAKKMKTDAKKDRSKKKFKKKSKKKTKKTVKKTTHKKGRKSLPFELKEPPSGTKLISEVHKDLLDNDTQEISVEVYNKAIKKVLLYDTKTDSIYSIFYKEREDDRAITKNTRVETIKEGLEKTDGVYFELLKDLDSYILFFDKEDNLKYTCKRRDLYKYMITKLEQIELEDKDLDKYRKPSKISVSYIYRGTNNLGYDTATFKINYESDPFSYRIVESEAPEANLLFKAYSYNDNKEYFLDTIFDGTKDKGVARVTLDYAKNGKYEFRLYIANTNRLVAKQDFNLKEITPKEELDPDRKPIVTIKGIPNKKIPLGTEHKITIKTDIPCKIGVDHETTDKYITEYTFIVTKNEKDKYYMAVAENGRYKEGYLDIDFFDTPKVVEETKAEDKPLVVPDIMN